MTNKDINDKLKGRKITHVDLRPFDDGRGVDLYSPAITFDDGSRLVFTAEAGANGRIGIRPSVFRRPRPAPGKERAKGTARR